MAEPSRSETGIPIATLVAYALPALPLAALAMAVYVYLPSFIASELGLPLTVVGAVLLLGRLWDFVTDPIVGQFSDSLRTPIGRRRPWIIAGLPLVLLGMWNLFSPNPGMDAIEVGLWMLVSATGWTAIIIPLRAWGADLSDDYHGRSRVAGLREAAVILGTLLAAGLPFALGYGADDLAATLHDLGLVIVVVLPVSLAILLWRVPEPPRRAWQPLSWRKGARLLANNRPLRAVIGANVLNGIANGLPATLFLLFVGQVLEAPAAAGGLLLTYFASGIVGMPIWLRLSRAIGKHRAWAASMAWAALIFPTALFLGPGDETVFLAICVLTGLGLGADLIFPAAIQADIVDHDAAVSGRDRSSLLFAISGMATKLSLAISIGIAFPLLDAIGFSAKGENDSIALLGLAGLYGLAPVLFKLAAIRIVWRFPIDETEQHRLRLLVLRHGQATQDLHSERIPNVPSGPSSAAVPFNPTRGV